MNQEYTLDNAWSHARKRLDLLETVLNPVTIRHLDRLGVAEGWHCLDVGAGGGSIAEWLCRRVGANGHVLATDINTRFLDVLDYPNLEVRRHDITTEALPEAAFDLVHTRAVLCHLVEPALALRRMVAALKPGGWLLADEVDNASSLPDPRFRGADLYAKGRAAFRQVTSAGGFDHDYGRRLYADVRAAGLIDVDAAGNIQMLRAHTPFARCMQLTYAQNRVRIVGANLLTDEEMDRFIALHDDEDFAGMSHLQMAVWGRKPG
ncbi:MAG TPA: methyltransferase domain-containing protein [Chloroflexota bacterium]